jgi:HD-like signal output (HDOD) protein
MHLDELLESQTALPSIPRIVAMVLSELNREEPSLRAISQLINSDIGLATRLLGLANSAQFNFSHKIGSVSDALAVLGLDQVRSLTVAAAMAGAFKSVPGLELLDFWRYSLNVAKLSRPLARTAHVNPGLAFTAGLVHAAGELVMHLGMPDQMGWLNDRVKPLSPKRAKAEQHLLGYCYAQVGAAFAKRWEFPRTIVDALEHQCAPFEGEVCEPLAGVLYLATWRARAQEEGLSETQIADSFPYDVAAMLEIDIDEVLQREPINWTTNQESVDLVIA